MITIRQISSHETFPVRQPVLRPGKPAEECIFQGDDLPSTIHLGIYNTGELAGVLSIFKVTHELYCEKNQYQLGGMAVLQEHQKKGLGEQLLQVAEKRILENDGTLIWFNAREAAAGFYNKLGYEKTGNAFPIGDIGLHYVMFKKLR